MAQISLEPNLAVNLPPAVKIKEISIEMKYIP